MLSNLPFKNVSRILILANFHGNNHFNVTEHTVSAVADEPARRKRDANKGGRSV